MVTITPKKDFMSRFAILVKSKKVGFVLVMMGMFVFLGMVIMISSPSLNHDFGGHSGDPKRGRNQVLSGSRQEREHSIDPIDSKVASLRRMRNKIESATHDDASTTQGMGTAVRVHEHADSRPHHENPGINLAHGMKDSLDEQEQQGNEELDNSHHSLHVIHTEEIDPEQDKHVDAEDAMYHNKFRHARSDHRDPAYRLQPATRADASAERDDDKESRRQRKHKHFDRSDSDAAEDRFDHRHFRSETDNEPAFYQTSNSKSVEDSFPNVLRVDLAASIATDDTEFPHIRAAHSKAVTSMTVDETIQGTDGVQEASVETQRPLDGVELFHKALRSGALCVDRKIAYTLAAPSTHTLTTVVSASHGGYTAAMGEAEMFEALLDVISVTKPTAFLELSSKRLPLQQAMGPLVARVFPMLTVVLVPTSSVALSSTSHDTIATGGQTGSRVDDDNGHRDPTTFSAEGDKGPQDGSYQSRGSDSSGDGDRGTGRVCLEQSHPSNLHYTEQAYSPGANSAFLDGTYSCVQTIDALTALVGKQLPFEFEESLSRLLCRCSTTILPKDLPSEPYFSYWQNTESLVNAAVHSLGLCSIRVDYTNSKSYAKKIRFTHIVLHRVESSSELRSAGSVSTRRMLKTEKFVQVKLSSPSGHIPVEHLLQPAQKGVQGPSLHHLTASLLEYYEASTLTHDYTSSMEGLVVEGSVVTRAEHSENTLDKSKNIDDAPLLRRASLHRAEEASSGSSTSVDSRRTPSLRGASSRRLSSASTSTPASNTTSTETDSSMPRVRYAAIYESVLSSTWEFPYDMELELGLQGLHSERPSLDRWDEMTERVIPDKGSEDDPKFKGKVSPGMDFLQGAWSSTDSVSQANAFKSSKKSSTAEDLSDISPINEDARVQQRLLQNREEIVYRKWLSATAVHWNFSEAAESDVDKALPKKMSKLLARSKLVYIFGRKVSMLSAKIASSMEASGGGLLVSVLTDAHAVESHQSLLKMLDIRNNIICHSLISAEQLAALLLAPERAGAGIVQLDVFTRLLVISTSTGTNSCAGMSEVFEELLASLLQLSSTTFIEIPSHKRWHELLELVLPPTCSDRWLERYASVGDILARAVGIMQSTGHIGAVIRPLHWYQDGNDGGETLLYRVTVHFGESREPTRGLTQRATERGVSVYTLGHLGMDRSIRRKVLALYAELPVWVMSHTRNHDVSPWEVFATFTSEARGSEQVSDPHALLRLHYYPSTNQPLDHSADASSHHEENASIIGTSLSDASTVTADRRRAKLLFSLLKQEMDRHAYELAGGKFSFVEHGSGHGYLSAYLAAKFPNATILSLERDNRKTYHHARMVEDLGLLNNAVCEKNQADTSILLNIVECPELFRFQLVAHGLVDAFSVTNLEEWGQNLGTTLSSAMTTFLYVPSGQQVSHSMSSLFPWDIVGQTARAGAGRLLGVFRPDDKIFTPHVSGDRLRKDLGDLLTKRSSLESHPISSDGKASLFNNFESAWLLGHSKAHAGHVSISMKQLHLEVQGSNIGTPTRIRVPFVRCDITNMTRRVHHHYDFKKDGHKRTYTMEISVNTTLTELVRQEISRPLHLLSENGSASSTVIGDSYGTRENGVSLPPGAHPNQNLITSVFLHRDKDSWPIPYTSIYGITLISTLRLGLHRLQRERLFHDFLKLPLYEDMAPWNVVLMGPHLDYIDYDTRDVIFDGDIPKAYRVMSVLMNYKRTVEDFKRCGSKAPTVYGLPYVSDCVGSNALPPRLSCPELSLPVPCADGACHTDYISCLRSLSDKAMEISAAIEGGTSKKPEQSSSWHEAIAEAMKSHNGGFDEFGMQDRTQLGGRRRS
eukprot:GSChrysophyteH1.ASY1.ANO1.689.1 assembled CDS